MTRSLAAEPIQRDVRTLDRRLKDRVTAGRMVVAFLQEAELEELPWLPPEVARLSINELALFVK